MKAITVRQPWAWAIIHGGKDVENRTRNIAGGYRGPLVIHAGKAVSRDDLHAGMQMLDMLGIERPKGTVLNLGFGVALGVVDLVSTHGEYDCPGMVCSPWAIEGQHHLMLANPRPFPEPVPYRGQLGLWYFPDVLLPEVAW